MIVSYSNSQVDLGQTVMNNADKFLKCILTEGVLTWGGQIAWIYEFHFKELSVMVK